MNHSGNCMAFFKNGFLTNVSPRNTGVSLYEDRGVAYCATEIESDGMVYSLLSPQSIQAIPVPQFSDSRETTFSLDYILRMCASNFRNRKNHHLSILVLQKAVEIMPFSNIDWNENDYLRLPFWLYEDGRIKEGLFAEQFIKTSPVIQEKTDMTFIARRKMFQIQSASDLVAFNSYSGLCCAECAAMSGRVYSFSGNDESFPPIPHELLACGGYHCGCNTGLSRYYKGDSIYYMGSRVDPLLTTFRESTDERTTDDILRYEQAKKNILKSAAQNADRKEYLILKTLCPQEVPSSQFKFACKKVNEPIWYASVHKRYIKEKALLLGAEGLNG